MNSLRFFARQCTVSRLSRLSCNFRALRGQARIDFSIDIFHTGAKLDYMDNNTPPSTATAAKKQSLLHVGSEARDALEAIGASMTPPCRWQDLARSVLKNFIGSQVHDDVLGRAQLRLPVDNA